MTMWKTEFNDQMWVRNHTPSTKLKVYLDQWLQRGSAGGNCLNPSSWSSWPCLPGWPPSPDWTPSRLPPPAWGPQRSGCRFVIAWPQFFELVVIILKANDQYFQARHLQHWRNIDPTNNLKKCEYWLPNEYDNLDLFANALFTLFHELICQSYLKLFQETTKTQNCFKGSVSIEEWSIRLYKELGHNAGGFLYLGRSLLSFT